jgi:transposase
MIQITAHMHIVAAVEPVDFRKGIDSLAAVCRQKLESDPFCGGVFVFVNKSKTALRLLIYDGQGFWLCHKRLSRGRFVWNFHGKIRKLAAQQLQMLLWNSDPCKIMADEFRPIAKTFFQP